MGRRIGRGVVLVGVAGLAWWNAPAIAAPLRAAAICQGSVPDRHQDATIAVTGNRLTFTDANGVWWRAANTSSWGGYTWWRWRS